VKLPSWSGEDTGGFRAGAAYLFERDAGGTWNEVAKLQASDKEGQDYFGASVSISGDRAVIGAWNKGTGGTAVGAGYVFERGTGDAWSEVVKLQASDKEQFDQFGGSVSISGDRLIVGAEGVDAGAGAVYACQRDAGGTWSEVAKLQASDLGESDYFGDSVSISGGRAIIGAWHEDTGAEEAGAAYVFEEPTTPVALTGFSAKSNSATVLLSWKLSVPTVNALLGVRVQRAETLEGTYADRTERPIEPAGSMTFEDKEVTLGAAYWYRLVLVGKDKSETISHAVHARVTGVLPERPTLAVVSTADVYVQISYEISRPATAVCLTLYDVSGGRIRELERDRRDPGQHTVVWDQLDDAGRRVARGVYFVELRAGDARLAKKVVLARE
jgi:hypothetical protein